MNTKDKKPTVLITRAVTLYLIFHFLFCAKITEPNRDFYYQIDDFNIIELEYNDLPYTYERIYSLNTGDPVDSCGVIMFGYNSKNYYHPVQLAQKANVFIDSYKISGNTEYIEKAALFASKLLEISLEINETIFFPYPFDYPMHGNEADKMIAPWYSGMAQGQTLSAFVRLYQATGESHYLTAAHKIFNSYSCFFASNKPWIAFIDDEHYYWIEEYPNDQQPDHTLNGFIFAIYGLYDDYFATQNSECKKLFQASITTIYKNIEKFRNEGDISAYCLKHRIKSNKYHHVYMDQLNMLYKMTGEKYFQTMAELFLNDHP